jgi:hypothetical protein
MISAGARQHPDGVPLENTAEAFTSMFVRGWWD